MALKIIQILISAGLVALIMLQTQGSGLGKAFGGQTAYHSKKGVEKVVFVGTIVLAGLFLITSLLNAFFV